MKPTMLRNLFCSIIIILCSIGCKKDFYKEQVKPGVAYNQAAVDKFLTPPSDASPLIIDIINNLKSKERQNPFLSSLIAVAGTAVWNKCISNSPNVGNATRNSLLKTNSETTRVSSVGGVNIAFIFIPLIDSVTLEVKTVLQCYAKDDTSFTYRVIDKAAISDLIQLSYQRL